MHGHFVTGTNSKDLIEDVVEPVLPSKTSNLEGGQFTVPFHDCSYGNTRYTSSYLYEGATPFQKFSRSKSFFSENHVLMAPSILSHVGHPSIWSFSEDTPLVKFSSQLSLYPLFIDSRNAPLIIS